MCRESPGKPSHFCPESSISPAQASPGSEHHPKVHFVIWQQEWHHQSPTKGWTHPGALRISDRPSAGGTRAPFPFSLVLPSPENKREIPRRCPEPPHKDRAIKAAQSQREKQLEANQDQKQEVREGKPPPVLKPFTLSTTHFFRAAKTPLPSLSVPSFSFLLTEILLDSASMISPPKPIPFPNKSHINIPCHSGTAVGDERARH